MLALRARERLRDLDLRPRKASSASRQRSILSAIEIDERVELDGRPVAGASRLERREPALAAVRRRSREVAGAQGRLAGALVGQRAGRPRTPGAVDEDADADASLSRSLTASTVPFFVATDCVAPEDARASAYEAPAPTRGVDRIPRRGPARGRDATLLALSRAGGGIGRRARLRA